MKKWMRAVLGPRALGLLQGGDGEQSEDGDGDGSGNGDVSLAEELKDGRLLVRLAHAVGGARTAGMAEVGWDVVGWHEMGWDAGEGCLPHFVWPFRM